METIQIDLDEFKSLLKKATSDPELKMRYEIFPMPPFEDEGISLDPNITLEGFIEHYLSNEEKRKGLEVWKKDKRQYGYFRYKVLDLKEDGTPYYAFDINEYVQREEV